METLVVKSRFFRSNGKHFALGLLLASILGLAPVTAVFADRDDFGWREGGGFHGEGREGFRGGDRDDWRRRERYGNGYGGYVGGYGGYGGGYQEPVAPQGYGYAQPVYVPPPVQYLPPQSPGINLVVPLNFR